MKKKPNQTRRRRSDSEKVAKLFQKTGKRAPLKDKLESNAVITQGNRDIA